MSYPAQAARKAAQTAALAAVATARTACPQCGADDWRANSSALTCNQCDSIVRREERAPDAAEILAQLNALRASYGRPPLAEYPAPLADRPQHSIETEAPVVRLSLSTRRFSEC